MKRAFPVAVGERIWDEGMNLRDYFAAKALQGLLAGELKFTTEYASRAYELADAMMKAREQ